MTNQSDAASTPSILKKTSHLDQGLIAHPILTPHLRYHRLEDQQILLVSESFNTLLRGKLYYDLIPLLDGTQTLAKVTTVLQEEHGIPDILSAIISLGTRGYVVSADNSLERSRAAYWSSLGISPCWVEEKLTSFSMEIVGDKELSQCLTNVGIKTVSQKSQLKVIVTDDLLSEVHAETNRQHLEERLPWLLVRSKGIEPLLSPVFLAHEASPCWQCFSSRLRIHQEVHDFLRTVKGEENAFKPFAYEPIVGNSIFRLAVNEIIKWILLEDCAPIHQHAVSIDLVALSCTRHRVIRRPQCPVCGDQELYQSSRKPTPLGLRSSPQVLQNSGGSRTKDPETTIAEYRHLVSPISGVVSWLSRTTSENDPWLHVHWAGSNFGMPKRTLTALRRSFRSKSAGKGSTRKQSEVSALCEAIERYSGSFQGGEISIRERFSNLVSDAAAIHPNEVQLFSEYQLNHAQEINAQGHPYNFVPPRFDTNAEVNWTPVWSFTQNRHRYLPTSMLYSMPTELRGPNDLIGDSNGCAAGNTLEEAILQGFYELVERDSFAIWWYNKLRVPGVDLTSFEERYLQTASEYYSRLGREIWLLDVTADLQIPTFVAMSRRLDAPAEEIIYGAGAHSDPKVAALRAVCELNQCLSWLVPSSNHKNPRIDDPVALEWLETARVENYSWLIPEEHQPLSKVSTYHRHQTLDLQDEVKRCFTLIHDQGMEFLVLDQTRPDIGMPVVRVIVPGLRHFWARFAPGRLYDVPVSMGRFENRLNESELNSTVVIV